jgi:hypothetical protein
MWNQSAEGSTNDDRSLCGEELPVDDHDEEEEDKVSDESRAPSEENALIGKQETLAVTRLRLVLLFVLAGSAVGVAIVVYAYLKGSEEAAFHAQ